MILIKNGSKTKKRQKRGKCDINKKRFKDKKRGKYGINKKRLKKEKKKEICIIILISIFVCVVLFCVVHRNFVAAKIKLRLHTDEGKCKVLT